VLQASGEKIKSIADIVELESRHLGERKRALILTEHIRQEDWPSPASRELFACRTRSRYGSAPVESGN
jgi:hypothetical protein